MVILKILLFEKLNYGEIKKIYIILTYILPNLPEPTSIQFHTIFWNFHSSKHASYSPPLCQTAAYCCVPIPSITTPFLYYSFLYLPSNSGFLFFDTLTLTYTGKSYPKPTTKPYF